MASKLPVALVEDFLTLLREQASARCPSPEELAEFDTHIATYYTRGGLKDHYLDRIDTISVSFTLSQPGKRILRDHLDFICEETHAWAIEEARQACREWDPEAETEAAWEGWLANELASIEREVDRRIREEMDAMLSPAELIDLGIILPAAGLLGLLAVELAGVLTGLIPSALAAAKAGADRAVDRLRQALGRVPGTRLRWVDKPGLSSKVDRVSTDAEKLGGDMAGFSMELETLGAERLGEIVSRMAEVSSDIQHTAAAARYQMRVVLDGLRGFTSKTRISQFLRDSLNVFHHLKQTIKTAREPLEDARVVLQDAFGAEHPGVIRLRELEQTVAKLLKKFVDVDMGIQRFLKDFTVPKTGELVSFLQANYDSFERYLYPAMVAWIQADLAPDAAEENPTASEGELPTVASQYESAIEERLDEEVSAFLGGLDPEAMPLSAIGVSLPPSFPAAISTVGELIELAKSVPID